MLHYTGYDSPPHCRAVSSYEREAPRGIHTRVTARDDDVDDDARTNLEHRAR